MTFPEIIGVMRMFEVFHMNAIFSQGFAEFINKNAPAVSERQASHQQTKGGKRKRG
jgi:hypothetical protein